MAVADTDYLTKLIRRLNLLSAKCRYSFTLGWTPMVTCTEHGDRTAYRLQLPNFTIPREVCPMCFANIFSDMKAPTPGADLKLRAGKTPVLLKEGIELEYVCAHTPVTGIPCTAPADYHNECVFCKEFFCKDHINNDFCCPDCLDELEGSFTHNDSNRGS